MALLFSSAQALFVAAFIVRAAAGPRAAQRTPPRAPVTRTAPGARTLVLLHMPGVALVSVGIWRTFAAYRGRLPASPRALAGVLLVMAASGLAGWALRVFISWRVLAKIDVGHALCTVGPYGFVRHPIYLALDLWAAGSALACPGTAALAGVAVIVVSGDLRARAEERILVEAFGDQYRSYIGRVRRMVPGVY